MNRTAITIAVLPFETLSPLAGDAMLARGFVHDLLTELAAFPQLGVIAAESSEAALNESPDDTSLAARLGAGCLLKGSFRRLASGLRVNVHLQDGTNGQHLWAGRYDSVNLVELHDEITARIVNALAAKLNQSILANARRRPPETLEAYECWLCGMDRLQRGTADSDEEARGFFQRALALDPHYAEAHAGMSLSYFNEWSCQAWGKWEEKASAAYAAALRAETMDSSNATVQIILARIEQYRRDFDRAAPRLERALALAPNDAGILIQLGFGATLQGDAEQGIAFAQRALELNPLGPAWYFSYLTIPHFALGHFEEALASAMKSPQNLIVDTPAYMAACAAHLGRCDEAARHLATFRDDFAKRIAHGRQPGDGELLHWVIHVNPFRNPAHSKLLADGLRRAGLGGTSDRTIARQAVPWKIANTFRKEASVWTIAFEHRAFSLPDLRGLHDLARILARPGQEFSCSDLAESGLHAEGIEAADSTALRNYRRRLRELDTEIEETGPSENINRLKKLEDERDALIAEIRRVTGLGGRTRNSGDAGERARSAVTWRIRHAIRKITAVHPGLGRHLENSVRTGSACSYHPEQPVEWHL